MIYVIGDIHGTKDKYDAMLEKLAPNFEDSVFVLGDVIDIGEDSIAILQDMMCRPEIYPVLGEHEYYAKKLFPLIKDFSSIDEAKSRLESEAAELMEKWLTMKSEKTISDFLSLGDEEKESIIDFLDEFQPYEEIEVGQNTFVLAHAGIRGFDKEKSLEEYAEEDFIFEAADYTQNYFGKGMGLVTGHTPTVAINKAAAGKIISQKGHIAIDCGCGYPGGRLAAVCLDKMKVYYC